MIAFPQLPNSKGIPQLTQNRQFQWYTMPSTFIYPIIPSIAATLLKENNFEVEFYDGIALRETYSDFLDRFRHFKPDIVAMETKTPVIKQHWKIIDRLKSESPDTNFVLMGDHVTALPVESLMNSKVDYVVSGGDFDVILVDLAKHLRDGTPLPKGAWHRQHGEILSTGNAESSIDLDSLPWIDRELTKWWLYREAYLFKPVTYLMAGRDCPYQCTFCSWSNILFPKMRYRSVENVLDEVETLVDKYKLKEVFDDTGTFTVSRKWTKDFCHGMMKRGLNDKVYYSINTRFDHLNYDFCIFLKRSGFRLLKIGLESGNDETLKKIRKGITVQQIRDGAKNAKRAGLDVFLTVMVGYPWETRNDVLRTIALCKELMTQGWADILQASIVIPYPGTILYKEALDNDWFSVDSKAWELFDMTQPVLTTPLDPQEIMKMCDNLWRIYLNPKYILRTIVSIRSFDKLKFVSEGFFSVLGHIMDFMR